MSPTAWKGVSTISTDASVGPGPEDETPLQTALKRSVAALKAEEVPFALAGGYALWVHGAPEPVHDVDLVVAEPDVPRAAEVLAAAGFSIERPPEDWLFKAWLEESLVDVLHRVNGVPVTSEEVGQGVVEDISHEGLRMLLREPPAVMADLPAPAQSEPVEPPAAAAE